MSSVLRTSIGALIMGALGACGGGDSSPVDSGNRDGSGGNHDANTVIDAPITCTLDTATAPTKVGSMINNLIPTNTYEQAQFAVAEINNGCGMLGTATLGTRIELVTGDGADPGIGATNATSMIEGGVVWLSTQVIAASALRIADTSVDLGVPITTLGASGSLTGCTTAQRQDSSITKASDPSEAANTCWDQRGLHFRSNPTIVQWTEGALQEILDRHPTARRMAVVYLMDASGPVANRVASAGFVAAGGGRTVTASVAHQSGSTASDWQTTLIPALVADDPEVILFQGRLPNFKALIEAYVALRDDTSDTFTPPAHYNEIAFVSIMGANNPGDWTGLTALALPVVAERHVAIFPTWDTTSTGFQRWRDAFLAYNPDGRTTFVNEGRFYDTTMILALATVAAGSTAGTEIAAHIPEVASPPGIVVYPGEYARARALLMAGEDINYEGASGPVDVLETGDLPPDQILFEVSTVDAESPGNPKVLEVFTL